jgi:hypothetical protein
LFVCFQDGGAAKRRGFDPRASYPVFHVDVADGDDGLSSSFLMANRDGEFSWVPQDEVRRAPPPSSRPRRGEDRPRRSREDDRPRRPREGARDARNGSRRGREDEGRHQDARWPPKSDSYRPGKGNNR